MKKRIKKKLYSSPTASYQPKTLNLLINPKIAKFRKKAYKKAAFREDLILSGKRCWSDLFREK